MLYFRLWQMILVAIFGKTGFFDYVALKVRRKLCTNARFNEDFHLLTKFVGRALIGLIISFNHAPADHCKVAVFNQLGAKPKPIEIGLCLSVFPRLQSALGDGSE